MRRRPAANRYFETGFGPYLKLPSPHTHQLYYMADGTGGECRRTLHAVGSGYGFLVHSPTGILINPMVINTHASSPSERLLPRSVVARAPSNSSYNYLGECPCTDRMPVDLARGQIGGRPFIRKCAGDLARQRNPGCELRTYSGGINCCTHGGVLLDYDQEAAFQAGTVHTIRYKYRIYYEPHG